jgi:hypothetical protein
MPRDNPLSIVPMFIYPPGYNFNGFLLFDPLTESWSSGDGIIRSSDNVEPPIPSGGFETNTDAFFHQISAFIVSYVTGSRWLVLRME